MNIFVICHYGNYEDLGSSFVHAQIQEYVRLGHRVRALIPMPVGKRDRDGKRFSGGLLRRTADGVELCDLRFLSLSNYGREHFNTASALRAVRNHWDQLFGDFRPDILHAHTLGLDSEIGVFLKERLHVPLVVTTHGSDAVEPIRWGKGESCRKWCEKADVVVAVSSATADWVRQCGTDTPIKVLLNGYKASDLGGGGGYAGRSRSFRRAL